MKKFLFCCIFIATFLFVSCDYEVGNNTKDSMSSVYNYRCSFVLQTPVGYDEEFGVGLSGQIYEGNKPQTVTLWLGKDLYYKMIKDSLNVKIYNGKCINAKMPFREYCYFVYFVE